MRKSLAALVLGVAVCGTVSAQSPSSARSWDRVMALPAGTAVRVHTRTHSAHCKVKSAEPDSLTCVTGGDGKTEVFNKADISNIKISHRGRSAIAGAAIGAGTGAAIGAAAGQNGQIIGRGGLAAIFAVPLALLGAIIGVSTDFTVATIYKA